MQQTWSDGVRSGAELAGRAAALPNRAWMSVGEPESRWPAGIAILVAIVLQFVLSLEYTIRPRWAIPALEIALLVVLLIANPKRIDTFSRSVRMGSLTLLGVLMLTNGWSALKLIRALLTGAGGKGTILLGTGAAIWATNTIAFGIWYWEVRPGRARSSQPGDEDGSRLPLPPDGSSARSRPAALGADLRRLPVPVIHQRDGLQPDRCSAPDPMGQVHDDDAVGVVARGGWSRCRSGREHLEIEPRSSRRERRR